MAKEFLHERSDFKSLLEITAEEQKIDEPSLVEKDYWIMHCLYGLQSLGFKLELKGGTSLSKGHGVVHRFSEDIDLKIDGDEAVVGFKIFSGKNHDDNKHRESRQKFFDWLVTFLDGKINGVEMVERDPNFDDIPKYRNGAIRLHTKTEFPTAPGLKEGILLEVGFDRTVPNKPKMISSWVYNKAEKTRGISFRDNRAKDVPCYNAEYTFVEKLQAVIRKYRMYKEGKGTRSLPANFLRHYYDIYQLLDLSEVQQFIGTPEYLKHKKERFGSDDIVVANSEAFRLPNMSERALFEKEIQATRKLYYRGAPTLQEMLNKIAMFLPRL